MVLHQGKPFEIIIIKRHVGYIMMGTTSELPHDVIFGNARPNSNSLDTGRENTICALAAKRPFWRIEGCKNTKHLGNSS